MLKNRKYPNVVQFSHISDISRSGRFWDRVAEVRARTPRRALEIRWGPSCTGLAPLLGARRALRGVALKYAMAH